MRACARGCARTACACAFVRLRRVSGACPSVSASVQICLEAACACGGKRGKPAKVIGGGEAARTSDKTKARAEN
eukprot:1691261-Pleurochrysis_carterae.AAC.1